MSIDWSKYGVDTSANSGGASDVKTSVDFSKYAEPKQPDFQQQEQKFGPAFQNPAQSPVMQQADQNNAANPSPPTTPLWNGLLDNPIVHGVETALDYAVNKPLQTVGTAVADIAGAGNNLFTKPQQGYNGETIQPSESHNLLKDIASIWSGNGSDVAHNAMQGAFPNDFSKNLPGTNISLGNIEENAAQFADLSPLLKGAQFGASKISDAFDAMFGRVKPSEATPIEQAQPILGLPEPRSAQRLRDAQQSSILEPNTSPIYGQGDVQTLGLPESQQYNQIQQIKAGQTLGLPEAQPQTIADFNRRNGNVLPINNEPIYGQGNVADPLGLPQGNYVPPTRLKVSDANQSLDYVMNKIKPEVMDIIQAPARRDLLVNYVQKNTGYPVNEIHNMPMKDLQDLGQQIQDQLHGNMKQIAYNVAAKHGHDLPALLEKQAPNLRDQMAKDAQSRVYGVPAEKVNIAKPHFNKEVTGQAAAPKQGLSFKREPKLSDAKVNTETPQQMQQRYERQIKEANDRKRISELSKPLIGRAAMPETKVKLSEARGTKLSETKNVTDTPKLSDMRKEVAASAEQPKLSDLKAPTKSIQNTLPKDELKFAQTVKASENTAPALTERLNEQTLTGKRTTDVLNRENAAAFIEKHGQEGAANKIIAKQGTLTPHEVTAAQILAKHYSSLGGEHNLNKALDLVGKTATKGREMGQAVQALSQWNKLDAEGALLQGSRSVGRTLTPAEGKPIIAATYRIQQVAATKSLADQVTHIITNKTAGEALTASEKDVIKQFQDQVKQVNEGVKPFLPKEKIAKEGKSDATIKEVSQIEPKARTRDQVVSFLDAKAEKARQRIAASRQMGFAAVNKGNPVIDYAIIGASHIAKGAVKLSDFTEQMVKDFGDSVKPHINEVFNKANNIFRKENGLPTVQELDKAVNGAIKNGTFTEEQAHQFKAWANEIGHMSDEFKIEATQDLQKAMNQIGDSTLGQKAATVQTSAQLLSLPTGERNVIGNEAFNLLEKINKVAAVPIDWTLSKLTGERHIVFATGNQEKYWQNFVKGAKGGWNGVSPNGQFASLDIHPEAFKGKYNPFRYLQKATGAFLQSFDHAAYRRAYGETLGTYAKLSGKDINELDQSIHELADHAGQYATFQDETMLSKLATGAKQLLNKPTDLLSDAAVKAGLPEKYSMKGFGAGDLVLKYAKTPANIIMRGIDYSPIGILRGMGELIPLLGKKEFNQRQAVLALSRGVTGTLGLTGLGYALASAGVITGSASSDKDIQQLDKMTGKGEYKVNWSALQRYVTSGLDKNAAKWQQGDKVLDWGWIQPMAISIAMGVNAQQSIAKQKVEGMPSMVTTVKDALIGSMNTILQQPLLQGTQQLVSGALNVARYGSWSGITNILKGAPASFVPSLVNQVRNSNDNTARVTYDPSALKSAINMIKNKIPGLESQLPVAYDSLGNPKEQIQGGQAGTLNQGLQSFASPVKPTTYTVSPQAKLVLDLIDATGNMQVAPRTPNSYVMVDKKKIPLTPEEYSQVQQQTGQLTQQMLTKITPLLNNPSIKDEVKAKEVIAVLDRVGKQVRNDLEKGNPNLKPHALRR